MDREFGISEGKQRTEMILRRKLLGKYLPRRPRRNWENMDLRRFAEEGSCIVFSGGLYYWLY
jgi:hypothetical protein